MSDRRDLSGPGNEDLSIRPLQALSRARLDYGLPSLAKPCVGYVLDGNLGGAGRHEYAFVIGLECRSLGLTQQQTERVLRRWAGKVGYRQNEACRVVPNVYLKNPDGRWHYNGIGLKKRPGTRAHAALSDVCLDVGCPHRCPAFANLVRRQDDTAGFEEFERLGWVSYFRRQRRQAIAHVYMAICDLEVQRSFAPGARLLTSTRQIAELAGHDRGHVQDQLTRLHRHGLLKSWVPGSGSGPYAHDRIGAIVERAIPIPPPPL